MRMYSPGVCSHIVGELNHTVENREAATFSNALKPSSIYGPNDPGLHSQTMNCKLVS